MKLKTIITVIILVLIAVSFFFFLNYYDQSSEEKTETDEFQDKEIENNGVKEEKDELNVETDQELEKDIDSENIKKATDGTITLWLKLGEPQIVEIDSQRYNLEAVWIGGVSGEATIKLKIDDLVGTESLNIGDTTKISGLSIRVEEIFPASVSGQDSIAKVIISE